MAESSPVRFPPAYVRMPLRALTRGGAVVKVSEQDEEALVLYVLHLHRHPSAASDRTFRANFWNDFREGSPAARRVARIDCDPSALRAAYDAAMRDDRYAQGCPPAVTAQDKVEPVARCTVERPGLFVGRNPDHPLRGRIRRRLSHADVTVNASTHAGIDASLPWKAVVRVDSPWLARWTCTATGRLRYIWLAPDSAPKTVNERAKFDFAARVHDALPALDAKIHAMLGSARARELGVALWLLRHLVLRVGPRDSTQRRDKGGAVGLTNLRRRHFSWDASSAAWVLAFEGKDMVPYRRQLTDLPDGVKRFLLRPAQSQGLMFPHVTPRLVNDALDAVMPGLTARVLRTHAASAAVQRALDEGRTQSQALRVAADICNHRPQTTLNNYVDPRILVADRKRRGADVAFPAAQARRFRWAFVIGAEYRFPVLAGT